MAGLRSFARSSLAASWSDIDCGRLVLHYRLMPPVRPASIEAERYGGVLAGQLFTTELRVVSPAHVPPIVCFICVTTFGGSFAGGLGVKALSGNYPPTRRGGGSYGVLVCNQPQRITISSRTTMPHFYNSCRRYAAVGRQRRSGGVLAGKLFITELGKVLSFTSAVG